jgi:hypothetical protein
MPPKRGAWRVAAVSRRLRSPFARGEGDFPLSESVGSTRLNHRPNSLFHDGSHTKARPPASATPTARGQR